MAKLPTTRESLARLDEMDAMDTMDATALARRWLATHPRPTADPNDPFPEDRLIVTWQTENGQGVIYDPWTQLENAIAEIGEGANTKSAIWMIRHITGRVK